MMTSYVKKIPAAIGLLFFSVACLVAVVNGVSVALAFFRGAIAGFIAFIFTWPLAYLIFHKEVPREDLPLELLHHRSKKPGEE